MRPICHGIKMAPQARTEKNGKTFITYKCDTCGHKEVVQIAVGV
jgi:ssDNA-binding Zn-finger/Zn-ribbon topoisomerase 1